MDVSNLIAAAVGLITFLSLVALYRSFSGSWNRVNDEQTARATRLKAASPFAIGGTNHVGDN